MFTEFTTEEWRSCRTGQEGDLRKEFRPLTNVVHRSIQRRTREGGKARHTLGTKGTSIMHNHSL